MHHSAAETVVPYEVPCVCGRSLRGQRQSTRQIVCCPSCGRKCFILPNSPWPAAGAPAPAGQVAHFNLNRFLFVILCRACRRHGSEDCSGGSDLAASTAAGSAATLVVWRALGRLPPGNRGSVGFSFQPDSAVLLSDERAAAMCCRVPLDEGLLDVLKRQDEWLRR
jgi:hypothetical protein